MSTVAVAVVHEEPNMAIDWWCWRLTLCSILLIVHNVVSAKESKIHNFMANPTGQLRTEEVEMVGSAKFASFRGLRLPRTPVCILWF